MNKFLNSPTVQPMFSLQVVDTDSICTLLFGIEERFFVSPPFSLIETWNIKTEVLTKTTQIANL